MTLGLETLRRGGFANQISSLVNALDLNRCFLKVRRDYFPRWDKRKAWVICYGTTEQLRCNTGYCDTAIKTIYIEQRSFRTMTDEGRTAFVIHEICHDVGAAFHNRAWANRMERAAVRAEAIDQNEVAAILKSDIESYCGLGVLEEYNPANVSEYVAELYWQHEIRDLDEAIRRTARHFGHSMAKVRRDHGVDIEHDLNSQI